MAAAPLLEAQPAKYLVAAINAYKTGVRPDPVMQTNVAKLSTRDIGDIADYFASRPAIAAVYPIDASKVAAGATRLGQLNCGTCHQPTFYGSDVVPRLAGQITGYLMQQLEAFAGGRRMHPPAEMPASTGDDMENISTYFTSLK